MASSALALHGHELLAMLAREGIVPFDVTSVVISGSAWEPVKVVYKHADGQVTLRDVGWGDNCCDQDHPLVKFLEGLGLLPETATCFEIRANWEDVAAFIFAQMADDRLGEPGLAEALQKLDLVRDSRPGRTGPGSA